VLSVSPHDAPARREGFSFDFPQLGEQALTFPARGAPPQARATRNRRVSGNPVEKDPSNSGAAPRSVADQPLAELPVVKALRRSSRAEHAEASAASGSDARVPGCHTADEQREGRIAPRSSSGGSYPPRSSSAGRGAGAPARPKARAPPGQGHGNGRPAQRRGAAAASALDQIVRGEPSVCTDRGLLSLGQPSTSQQVSPPWISFRARLSPPSSRGHGPAGRHVAGPRPPKHPEPIVQVPGRGPAPVHPPHHAPPPGGRGSKWGGACRVEVGYSKRLSPPLAAARGRLRARPDSGRVGKALRLRYRVTHAAAGSRRGEAPRQQHERAGCVRAHALLGGGRTRPEVRTASSRRGRVKMGRKSIPDAVFSVLITEARSCCGPPDPTCPPPNLKKSFLTEGLRGGPHRECVFPLLCGRD